MPRLCTDLLGNCAGAPMGKWPGLDLQGACGHSCVCPVLAAGRFEVQVLTDPAPQAAAHIPLPSRPSGPSPFWLQWKTGSKQCPARWSGGLCSSCHSPGPPDVVEGPATHLSAAPMSLCPLCKRATRGPTGQICRDVSSATSESHRLPGWGHRCVLVCLGCALRPCLPSSSPLPSHPFPGEAGAREFGGWGAPEDPRSGPSAPWLAAALGPTPQRLPEGSPGLGLSWDSCKTLLRRHFSLLWAQRKGGPCSTHSGPDPYLDLSSFPANSAAGAWL